MKNRLSKELPHAKLQSDGSDTTEISWEKRLVDVVVSIDQRG